MEFSRTLEILSSGFLVLLVLSVVCPYQPKARGLSLTQDSTTLTNIISPGIPVSAVGRSFICSSGMPFLIHIHTFPLGNARALADDGLSPNLNRTSPQTPPPVTPIDTIVANATNPNSTPVSLQAPASPNRRFSLAPGGTSKVLADLQTGVINARNALENTKTQLRLSQRTVAQLTRQTEDLKEGRERLRLENEGLNNVVARKERLLQEVCTFLLGTMLCLFFPEVLERARKAEAEAATLKSQLKTETTTSKRSLREMEAALAESTALSQKSEREYITLRDSIKSMTESWKHETDRLKDEMRKREDKVKKEAEAIGKKYKQLAEEMKTVQQAQTKVKDLQSDDSKIRKEIEEEFQQEIKRLRAQAEEQTHRSDEAIETAK